MCQNCNFAVYVSENKILKIIIIICMNVKQSREEITLNAKRKKSFTERNRKMFTFTAIRSALILQ